MCVVGRLKAARTQRCVLGSQPNQPTDHLCALCSAEALTALKEFQRHDFEGLFREMDGLPVTIRLLDPPLHEFLPHDGEGCKGRGGGCPAPSRGPPTHRPATRPARCLPTPPMDAGPALDQLCEQLVLETSARKGQRKWRGGGRCGAVARAGWRARLPTRACRALTPLAPLPTPRDAQTWPRSRYCAPR